MKFRHVGRSGLRVSEVALGNAYTHGVQVADDVAKECVSAALDSGINVFDTADVYADGRAEETLGRLVAGEPRGSLVICTKAGMPTVRGGVNDRGLSRKHLFESIDSSLRRLQTDYVDLYQAHRFDETTPLEETISAFADIVRNGKALYIGVSWWSIDQIRQGVAMAEDFGIRLISNQPQYSMIWRGIETEVIPGCEELGLSQLCWSPMAGGVLTGKYGKAEEAPGASRRRSSENARFLDRYFRKAELLERVRDLRPVANEVGISMAQLAVAWVLRRNNVASAIIGASRPEQVVEAARASGVELSADVLRQVDSVLGDSVDSEPDMFALPI